jgi:thiol-disulfide isomerase/thioredoxin
MLGKPSLGANFFPFSPAAVLRLQQTAQSPNTRSRRWFHTIDTQHRHRGVQVGRLQVTAKLRRRIVAMATATLLIASAALGVIGGSSSLTSAEGDLPEETFELFNGGDATFVDFGGKPLVINFWASWCPACVAELPEIQAVEEKYGDEINIVGLANADTRSAALDLAAEVGLTYTLADDPNGDLFRALDLIAMPSTVFVDADGEIREVFGGQLTEGAIADRLDDLVAQS